MKPIKVTEANHDKIQAAIVAVQKGARTRMVGADDVYRAVKEIERRLRDRLYKKDWAGLSFIVDPNAQKFASRYNGIPESTIFVLQRSPNGWNLENVYRHRTLSYEFIPRNLDLKAHALFTYVQETF